MASTMVLGRGPLSHKGGLGSRPLHSHYNGMGTILLLRDYMARGSSHLYSIIMVKYQGPFQDSLRSGMEAPTKSL
jgi:hypothetical protein